jgi:hypothetical protein
VIGIAIETADSLMPVASVDEVENPHDCCNRYCRVVPRYTFSCQNKLAFFRY